MENDSKRACSQCRKWAALLILRERDAPSPDLYCKACGVQEYETYHVVNLEMIAARSF
jgi:hypothetical protein